MTTYFSIAKTDNSIVQNLELAKEEGYTHLFMWVNSDLNWMFFAKSFEETETKAISLYMSEKKESNREFASEYYSEYIDTYEIDEYIKIIQG